MVLQSVLSLCISMLSRGGVMDIIPPMFPFTTTCFISLILTFLFFLDANFYSGVLPYVMFMVIVGLMCYFRDRNSPGYGRSRRRLRRDDQDRRSKPEILERKDDDETSQEGNDHSAQGEINVVDTSEVKEKSLKVSDIENVVLEEFSLESAVAPIERGEINVVDTSEWKENILKVSDTESVLSQEASLESAVAPIERGEINDRGVETSVVEEDSFSAALARIEEGEINVVDTSEVKEKSLKVSDIENVVLEEFSLESAVAPIERGEINDRGVETSVVEEDSFSAALARIEKEFPSVPEPTRKNSRRQKKKRNSLKFNKSKFKGAMDDSSETSSSNSDRYPKIETRKETTKVYQPLKLYIELNLEMYDLYHEFKLHVLTLKQLDSNSFPKEIPDRPGYIYIPPKIIKGSIERHCYRCDKLFNIHPDGRYEADSVCRYHPMKQKPFRRGQPYNGEYPCCNGNFISEGCVNSQYHVTAESYLHDVQFVRARRKKHLDEISACTVFAVDCEMLFTTAGMEVCKIGIVGVDGLTVYDTFVLPQNKILHYNTVYSGVAEKDLKGVSTTLMDVQAYLQKLLNKDSILVGHGLENDLRALRFIHEKVVDTSVVFPHPHGAHYKKSLKSLAKEYLNKDIQASVNGHDSIEDARTCMELMLYRINEDLKNRLPLTQDENRNAILQNIDLNPQPQLEYPVQSFSRYQTHRGNYYTEYDFFRNHFYSGYFMSKEPRVVY